MPTYEYFCPSCKHQFELYQSFSDKPIRKCPECKGNKVHKLISGGAGVLFKGDGFYETDYNRGSGSDYKKKADAEKKTSDPGTKDKKKKSESKTTSSSSGSKSEK